MGEPKDIGIVLKFLSKEVAVKSKLFSTDKLGGAVSDCNDINNKTTTITAEDTAMIDFLFFSKICGFKIHVIYLQNFTNVKRV